MGSTETPAQTRAADVRLMGPHAGEAFAELMQDAARLHLKWNEFQALFAIIAAIDDALHFVDHYYTGREAPMYDHLDIRGGAATILWIVRRDLQARDDDFAGRRPPKQFTD